MPKSQDEISKEINSEWRKIENPDYDDLKWLGKKFNVDIEIVRECVGLKDFYDFELDKE